MLTVRAPSERVDRVLQLLERHHPLDIEDHAGHGMERDASQALPLPATTPGLATPARAGAALPVAATTARDASATTARDATATTARDVAATTAGDDVLQLAEESLQVGKRVVNRGGTRLRRFVVETPVEQSVTLREEHVSLERHAVTDARPLAADAFTDKVVEMTETAEEAVVSKTARVIEEVRLKREAAERVETVRDTVRRQEVAVEQLPVDGQVPGARTPRV